jgi:hypothetical protein
MAIMAHSEETYNAQTSDTASDPEFFDDDGSESDQYGQ